MKYFKNTLFIVILINFFTSFSIKGQDISCQKLKNATSLPGLYYSQENLRSDTIDVLKYTVNLNITDFITDTIRGNVLVKFKPKINGQNKIRLDLLKMKIDSVKLNASKLTYSYNDTVIKVNLPLSYSTIDTVTIALFYHGKPQGDPSGWGGFYFSGNYAYNLGVGFGAKPHNYGRVWFPCFDNFVEKSEYEFNITTDTAKSSYCNGALASDTKTGSLRTRKWVMTKEIPSYLASVAVADYTQVTWTTSVATGTIPVILTARAADTTAMKNGFLNLKNAIAGFENYYGPYVWNRVGYCLVPFNSGAMEHATNISYPLAVAGNLSYEAELMAHELAHHWWGDLMTCETQEDMWLNEGFATYSAYMFKEWVYNKQQYIDDIKNEHEFLLHYVHLKEKQYRAVSGIPFEYTYGDHVYKKGADVAHTLRSYMGDAAFFAGIKYVMAQKAYKSMNSAEFKTLLETSSGQNLSDFFTNWVFNGGWPHFSIDSAKYTSIGSGSYSASVSLKEKLTGTSVLYNKVPLEVTFFDSNWNKTVKTFTMSGVNQTFTTTLNFNPVYEAINLDSKISDAISSEYKTIKTAGNVTYVLAKATLTISNSGADSSYLRIEHNYAKPDAVKFNAKNYKLSNQHYWKIEGILSSGFLAKIRLNFDGTPVPVTPSTPVSNLYLDTCLTSINSDSLVILYRRNAKDDWREVTKYTKVKFPGPGKSGYILVDTLKLGEYTFANKNGSNPGIGIKESLKNKSSLKLFPNPASNSVTIRVENYNVSQPDLVEIISIEGKVIYTSPINNAEIKVDCSTFPKGNYIVSIAKNKKAIAREKLILQ